eukprot:COSAG02_NODE_168_length_31711_cov_68.337973_20_plen_42_part_00
MRVSPWSDQPQSMERPHATQINQAEAVEAGVCILKRCQNTE